MVTVIRQRSPMQNVGRTERWATGASGGMLLLVSLRQRFPVNVGLALGSAALLVRALKGHCPLYATLGVSTADPAEGAPVNLPIRVEHAVTVQSPAYDLYRFWRDFHNLPRIMESLESVAILDDRRSHWIATGPGHTTVEWDAEIVNDIDGQVIGWRSLPGADVDHAGSVRFEPLAGGRGTEARVLLRYEPAGGIVGGAIAKLTGSDPATQLARDLRRFKQLIEAGEIATTRGQPAGAA